MAFTEEEITYLRSQRLARIATVDPEGQPDVAPVGFEFDGTYFYVGGIDPARTPVRPRRRRGIRTAPHRAPGGLTLCLVQRLTGPARHPARPTIPCYGTEL